MLGWEPAVGLDAGLAETIRYFQSISRADKKILVFATTYYPDHGPAEQALMDMCDELQASDFDIITARFTTGRAKKETDRKSVV